MSEVLFIPDVHGRPFWREAIHKVDSCEQIVFLGDYLDPYPIDGIPKMGDLDELLAIIAFKKAHSDKVTLLFGNHDTHYAFDLLPCSRHQLYRASTFRKCFEANMGLFTFAKEVMIGGMRCLVTHAGVHRGWYEAHKEDIGDLTADNLNKVACKDPSILDEASTLRGGYCDFGSPIWAHVSEFVGMEPFEGLVQVFGHTRQDKGSDPLIGRGYAMMDIQRLVSADELVERGLTSIG